MSFLGQAAVIVEDDIDIFLDKFAEQSEGWEDAELQKEQFRSLFTAWCLLNNVDADTRQCDEKLRKLYEKARLEELIDFEDFCNYMLRYLI